MNDLTIPANMAEGFRTIVEGLKNLAISSGQSRASKTLNGSSSRARGSRRTRTGPTWAR